MMITKKTKTEHRLIITIPPYADYMKEIVKCPYVKGVRLNTVMPLKDSIEEELERMNSYVAPKDFWLDLKGRQLRTINYATPPYKDLRVSHRFKVKTPCKVYFCDGIDEATLSKVDGNKLIMLDGPKRLVGPGESINIIHPSLEIEGYLTRKDKKYIQAAKNIGMHKYMLSYVEKESDLTDVLEIDPKAEIVAKIESEKGLEFISNNYSKYKDNVRLMAARGDLYVEVNKPHLILNATRDILRNDPDAIVASRFYTSLRDSPIPTCPEISDTAYLMELGYKNFMIGDDICFNKYSLDSAVNIMSSIFRDYKLEKREYVK